MYFLVVEAESNQILWNGSENSKSFNVAEASDDEGFLSGAGMLIVIGLATLILILLVVVVILARRDSGDGTYEYEYEMRKRRSPMQRFQGQDRHLRDHLQHQPRCNPLMAAALAEFPQWE